MTLTREQLLDRLDRILNGPSDEFADKVSDEFAYRVGMARGLVALERQRDKVSA